MTCCNQGRNEIRVSNSDAKCLLENWVEERAVDHIDPSLAAVGTGEITSSAQVFKNGHKGIITADFDASSEQCTTTASSFRIPRFPGVRIQGKKGEAFEKMLYEKASEEVKHELNPPPQVEEYKSTFMKDYNIDGFVPKKKIPTATHDYVSDQPATFWSEHREKIHGTTQMKTRDTVFRKNSSFSKPIDEYMNQPMPYEQEMVPKM